jgi:hypothetical protein
MEHLSGRCLVAGSFNDIYNIITIYFIFSGDVPLSTVGTLSSRLVHPPHVTGIGYWIAGTAITQVDLRPTSTDS